MTTETLSKRDQAKHAMRRSWFPVARSVDLDAGTPVAATLLGERLVVYRGEGGQPRVTSARCPHRGGDFTIGKVHGDEIACPYHGWRFDGRTGGCTLIPSLEDQGRIPPRTAIHAYPAIERFAHVWTVLEDPIRDMYDPAEWSTLDLEWLAADPIDSPTGVAVAIENFRDVAHFPFVHEVSMGPSPAIVEPLVVRREGLEIFMDRPLDASTGEWAEQGDCMMHYHCAAPGLAAITYEYEKLGRRIVAGFPSPVSYEHVTIFWGVANERTFSGDSIQECLRIEEIVYLEDVPVVERLSPREVPWDREAEEFSVPADLFTLNYRRAFGELMARLDGAGEREPVTAGAGAA